jgi:3-oxoacyl-[acyl-carrier protein] reductase
MGKLMGKTVLITGASGAIGRATALKLAEQGYQLALHYHTNQNEMEALYKQIKKAWGADVELYQADLSQPDGVNRLIRSLVRSPDIFIWAAGMAHSSLMVDINHEEYEKMIQLNLTAPFKITQHILPAMIRKRWGRIVYVTSIWGETGGACETLYSMTKGGLNALAKALAKEVAPTNITVNAVSPGAIDTPMLSRYSIEEKQALMEKIPLSRLGQATEVAHAIQFLIQEQTGYITGEVLRVNGGWLT